MRVVKMARVPDADLPRTALVELRAAALETSAISEEAKLAVIADLDALRSQLAKPQPSRDVARMLWSGVETVVTAGGLAELATRVAEVLAPLLSRPRD